MSIFNLILLFKRIINLMAQSHWQISECKIYPDTQNSANIAGYQRNKSQVAISWKKTACESWIMLVAIPNRYYQSLDWVTVWIVCMPVQTLHNTHTHRIILKSIFVRVRFCLFWHFCDACGWKIPSQTDWDCAAKRKIYTTTSVSFIIVALKMVFKL